MGSMIGEGRAGASVRTAGAAGAEVLARGPAGQEVRAPAAARAQVQLCGGLRVTAGGRSLGPRQLGGAKPRQILVALLLRREQAVSKASLVELLWADTPPAGAMSTLEGYVSLLRKRLDTVSAGLGRAVRTVPGGYLLDLAGIEVDVHRFRDLSARARARGGADVVRLYAEALDVVGGALLPDEGLDWVVEARRRLGTELLQVLDEAAEAALAEADLEQAHRWARRALASNPFDEKAWRVVLESCRRRGLHAEGLRAYDECRRLFADELGCTPGPGIREVFARLLESVRQVDDDPLAALVDAVVRLHLVVSSPDASTRGPRRHGAGGADAGVEDEDDWRLLERFLSMARSRRVSQSPLSA
ncbi:BTAD domain-containing putative transcriptional regulator [Terrabacter sp. BE26]|uniref:AfsR/SARP family transcriptional regulator n=1 Tax=Terrabacter sp. BE26 TaxID=2898152 RepID=UPI0035BE53E3